MGYKTSILNADQLGIYCEQFICSYANSTIIVSDSTVSYFQSFYAYLIVAIAATILQNIYIWHVVNNPYPYVAHIRECILLRI